MNIEETFTATEERLLGEASSLAELLERLRSRISPVLIGDRQWERLLERVHELPAAMAARPFGFELPLHAIQPEADFGVSVIGGSRSAAFFEERGRSQDADPSTAAIARLLNKTAPDSAPLRRVAGRKMLLEYDIESTPRGAHPAPGIFLYPAAEVLPGDGSSRRLRDLGIAADAVVSTAGWEPDAAERSHVERLYLAMEPDTRIRAVGAFPSRARALRIAVTGFRKTGDVIAFLERSGWSGSHAAVASTVSRLEDRDAFTYMGVHLDVRAEGLGPALGLSFFAREQEWLKDIRYWTPLIDGIREWHLAVPEKLAALADSSSGAEALFGKSGVYVLVRGVHHVKLVVTGNRVEQVKAYVFMVLMGARPQTKAADG